MTRITEANLYLTDRLALLILCAGVAVGCSDKNMIFSSDNGSSQSETNSEEDTRAELDVSEADESNTDEPDYWNGSAQADATDNPESSREPRDDVRTDSPDVQDGDSSMNSDSASIEDTNDTSNETSEASNESSQTTEEPCQISYKYIYTDRSNREYTSNIYLANGQIQKIEGLEDGSVTACSLVTERDGKGRITEVEDFEEESCSTNNPPEQRRVFEYVEGTKLADVITWDVSKDERENYIIYVYNRPVDLILGAGRTSVAVSTYPASSNPRPDIEYKTDDNGVVTQVTINRTGWKDRSDIFYTQRDQLDQVKFDNFNDGDIDESETIDFTYDDNGTLVQRDVGQRTVLKFESDCSLLTP